MPMMPPLVSTSSTRNVAGVAEGMALEPGRSGHGTRSIVVRTALMVMSVMACVYSRSKLFGFIGLEFCRHCEPVAMPSSVACNRRAKVDIKRREVGVGSGDTPRPEDVLASTSINIAAYSDALVVLGTAGVVVPLVRRWGFSPVLGYLGAGAFLGPLGLGLPHRLIPGPVLGHGR